MGSKPITTPLIAIVGQTASGKSAVAMQIAEKFGGEIIAADSRTIYKGMDIGTAKPSLADRTSVPHHLLDLVEPDEIFSAVCMQRLAYQAIHEIAARGRVPLLVGGTGLYVNSVLYDYSFRSCPPNPELRKDLEGLSVQKLQALVRQRGGEMPNNDRNPRYLIRAIETAGCQSKPVQRELRPNTLIIGFSIEKEELARRIAARLDAMLAAGLKEEVAGLARQYGWDCAGMQSIGYSEFRDHFEHGLPLDLTCDAVRLHSLQYAKRQKTWFKRNKNIHWISKPEEAVDLVTSFLNK